MNNSSIENILEVLDATIVSRKADLLSKQASSISYVSKLLAKGDDAILKKIGEESTEVVMAAKDSRAHVSNGAFNELYQQQLVGEVADLWFHSLVLLGQFELSSADVLAELKRREGQSGILEKASRKPSTS